MQSHFPHDHPGGSGKEGNVGTSFQLCYSRGMEVFLKYSTN